MNHTFYEKKSLLLSDLHMLALRHNRAYYSSLIPAVENTGPEECDLIDMYQAAILADSVMLSQSRQALGSIEKVENILVS